MTWWWSYLLTAVGVFGLYLAGRKSAWGWAVGIGAQGLWIAYATATHQWGFYVSSVAYGWVYVKNFLRWSREAKISAVTHPAIDVWGGLCGECGGPLIWDAPGGTLLCLENSHRPSSKPERPPKAESGCSLSHCRCGCGETVR